MSDQRFLGQSDVFCSSYLIPKAAFALMPIPLVIQYRVKARKLMICPSQRIYVGTTLLLRCIFSFHPLETVSHTLSKILSSVT
jgi:hypothetical protein